MLCVCAVSHRFVNIHKTCIDQCVAHAHYQIWGCAVGLITMHCLSTVWGANKGGCRQVLTKWKKPHVWCSLCLLSISSSQRRSCNVNMHTLKLQMFYYQLNLPAYLFQGFHHFHIQRRLARSCELFHQMCQLSSIIYILLCMNWSVWHADSVAVLL